MPRRIKKADVRFLSLCKRGANGMKVMYKSDGQMQCQLLVKAEGLAERGELLTVVYTPDVEDSQGDFAEADVIQQAAHEAMRKGLQIDIQHDGKPVGTDRAYVAESFIVQPNDARFEGLTDYEGNLVDPAGGWGALIKIDDPELRKLYSDGAWDGISMGGTYEVEPLTKADDQDKVLARLMGRIADVLGLKNEYAYQTITLNGDIDMSPEELNKTLDGRDQKITKSVTESVTGLLEKAGVLKKADDTATAPAAEEPKKAKAPEFEGDLDDEKAVRKFAKSSAEFRTFENLDRSDHKALAKARTDVVELETEILKEFGLEPLSKSNTDTDDPDSRRTAQPIGGESSGDRPNLRLSKQEQEDSALGDIYASFANGETEVA